MSNLRANVIALALLQVASFALPLVTLPYLTRVLGLETFGLVVLVQAVMQYFVLLTGWGFSWSATRKLSAHRDDRSVVDDVYSATWAAQWLLLVTALCILIIAYIFVPIVEKHAYLFFWGFTAVLGNVLFPIWLLQGLEKMRAVAIVQVLARVCVLPAYFLVIDGPADAYIVIALNGGTTVLAGIFTLWWIRTQHIVSWTSPRIERVLREIRECGLIFVSQTWISLYTTLIPIALGVIAGTASVAIYNLADKFRSAGLAMLSPLSQALFPRMSYLFAHDPVKARILLHKSSAVLSLCSLAGCLVLFFGADLIISIFGGVEFGESATVLRWLSPIPLIVVLSNILGVQIMLPLKLNREFSSILGVAGVISLLSMAPLIHWRAAQGAAISALITEICVTAGMAIYIHRIGFFSLQIGSRKNEG